MIDSAARKTTLQSAFALLLIAGLAACGTDSSDPAGPGEPAVHGPSEVALASDTLMSGGSGVLVSDGFIGLELEPVEDDEGTVIPDRWTNLRVTVGGQETDVRRLDDRSVEFSVPTVPAGTYGVDVASPFAYGSISARVLGVIASRLVVPCSIAAGLVALTPVGDALVFDADCWASGGQHHGVGVTWPAVPERGFEWLPEGEVAGVDPWANAGPSYRPNHFVARRSASSTSPEFWVWEAGPDPRPVEPLDCFGTADVSREQAAPAEVGNGTCLLIAPESGQILRDGDPVAEWPSFNFGHFVMSDDGWVTARGSSRLVVFDPSGNLVVNEDVGFIRDARFAPDGGPLYVAMQDWAVAPDVSALHAIDRATGEVLRETTVAGTVTAIAASTGRLWIARTTEPGFAGGELFVELFDPETLEPTRSIAVSRDLAVRVGFGVGLVWPYHGDTPVLLEDATGTRLTYTGKPLTHGGLWSHVVEVF